MQPAMTEGTPIDRDGKYVYVRVSATAGGQEGSSYNAEGCLTVSADSGRYGWDLGDNSSSDNSTTAQLHATCA